MLHRHINSQGGTNFVVHEYSMCSFRIRCDLPELFISSPLARCLAGRINLVVASDILKWRVGMRSGEHLSLWRTLLSYVDLHLSRAVGIVRGAFWYMSPSLDRHFLGHSCAMPQTSPSPSSMEVPQPPVSDGETKLPSDTLEIEAEPASLIQRSISRVSHMASRVELDFEKGLHNLEAKIECEFGEEHRQKLWDRFRGKGRRPIGVVESMKNVAKSSCELALHQYFFSLSRSLMEKINRS